MSDPVELGPRNDQPDLLLDEALDNEEARHRSVSEVVRRAAEFADETATQAELGLPKDIHTETVTVISSTFSSSGFMYTPIPGTFPDYPFYRSYANEHFGERIPLLLEAILNGSGYYDGIIDLHDPDRNIGNHNRLFLHDVIEIESDHPDAQTVRNALVFAKFTGAINTYTQQRLAPLANPGGSTEFMPKRLKSTDQIQDFWQRTLVGNGVQVGILPAERLSRRYFYAMRAKLGQVSGIDPQVLEDAIMASNFLKSSRSEKTAPKLRRPLLEAILAVDEQAIIQALKHIVDSEPYVLTVPIGHLLDMSEDDVAKLKADALQNRGEARERAKVAKREKELALRALQPVARFNSSNREIKAFHSGIAGKSYISADGLQLVEINEEIGEFDLQIVINYLEQEDPSPGAKIKKRHARRLPSAILHNILSGEWIEV